jgi:serine phosphatase RsbU (regulator of sigma subunit)
MMETDRDAVSGSQIKIGQFRLLDAARTSGKTSVHGLRPKDSLATWPKLKGGPLTQEAMARESRLLIAVPLLTKADLLGVLLVEEGNESRRYRRRRFEIINGAAQQIAMALQDDLLQSEMVARERLETEAQLAQQIQRAFLPDVLPRRSGWELAVRWETAREVGGDFYDVVEFPDGGLGLFVADVADKGMPAALFMALTRTLFRATVADGASPAQALARMNDLLLPDTRTGMFVTAVYGVLDPATGDFTYANAGHNPPLWIRPGQQVEALPRTSMALGVMESAAVDQRTIRLRSGESLLLYTDGLTEAFSPAGELFGEGRLLRTLRKLAASSAEDTLESIHSSLRAFIGQLPLSDDLTMVLLRRT